MQYSICPIRAAMLVALAAVTVSTLGCGTSAPSSPYVYVGQGQFSDYEPGFGTGAIAQLKVAGDGKLTSLNPAAVALDDVSYSIAIDPSSRYLLSVGSQSVTEYVVGTDGTLAPNPAVMPVMGSPVLFTPNGHFVISTGLEPDGLPSNTVNSYSISSDGSLRLAGTATLPGSTTVYQGFGLNIVIDPSSRFVYAGNGSDDLIYEYALSTTGALTPVGTFSAGSVGFELSISPGGFLYSSVWGPGGMVDAFRLDHNNGTLSQTGSFVLCPYGNGEPITFSPSGAYAYVGCNALLQFRVDPNTGVLTRNGPDLPGAGRLTFDPSGHFAFGLKDGGTVYQFIAGPDGTLSLRGEATVSTTLIGQCVASTDR